MSQRYRIADFLETKSAVGPSFSASGRKIAYLANLSGTFQAYVQDLAGGEAVQVTDYDDPIGTVAFNPIDDRYIIFSKDEKGNEKHQLYLLDRTEYRIAALLPGADPGMVGPEKTYKLTSDSSAMYRFAGWSADGRLIAYTSNTRNGIDQDVYVRDVGPNSELKVFDLGGWCECFGFSPSGRWLVVSKAKSGGYLDTELYLVDSTGKDEPKLLTPHEEKAYYGWAEWLPDESGFWTLTDELSDELRARMIVVRESGLSANFVGINTTGSDLEEIAITEDGCTLASSTNIDGYSHMSIIPSKGLPVLLANRELPAGQIMGLTWSGDGKTLAFAMSAADSNYNVWIWDQDQKHVRQVTAMPKGVPTETLVNPELIKYKSFDGLEVPAFLFLPHERSISPLPAVVHIHGGPEGQFRPSFNPVIQYLVYRGYAVIAPNVRGSAGYGKRYLALDDREKRLDSVADLAALHRWISEGSIIDPKRVALMGGSYGGYMVLAGLAFQPELWAAGVDTVGIANLVTFLENTSSYRRALREAEYGFLATDREFLIEASPINKVDQIRAPLMIIHGANDPRVPLSEAIQMRDSLAARGIEVELLVYEDEGHGLAKLKNRLDAYPKVAAFLDATLDSRPAAT